MAEEIIRRQVGNVWETVAASASSGGVPDPSGGSDGDVVTVESGAYVLQPGGGSLPGVVPIVATAEQISANWDGDTEGIFELTGIPAGAVVLNIYDESNTLDQSVIIDSVTAYLSGAAVHDVLDNGDNLGATGGWQAQTYSDQQSGTAEKARRAHDGASLYLTFAGDAAPTTGAYTATALVFYP